MTAPFLPIDIWLIIFDYIDAAYDILDDTEADSLTVLWCVVRSVSPYLRDCVDEHFRHGSLPNALIVLSYSNINHHGGPAFAHLHVPMRFSRLSTDENRAVFRQYAYEDGISRRICTGSVRGWVPFAERWYAEMRKPRPHVVHRGQAMALTGRPAWEKEHLNLLNALSGEDKRNYLKALREHTSIGRGYRPPFYLKLREAVNDTELIGLAVNVEAREISFDWRRTFAQFFTEQHFIMLSERGTRKRSVYDGALVAAANRAQATMHMHDYWDSNNRCARRKRLQSWVEENKQRTTPEDRLKAEDGVEYMKNQVRRNLRPDLLRELRVSDLLRESEELVPEACAEDLPYLLQWPWVHEDTYMVPRRPVQLKCGRKGCLMM